MIGISVPRTGKATIWTVRLLIDVLFACAAFVGWGGVCIQHMIIREQGEELTRLIKENWLFRQKQK